MRPEDNANDDMNRNSENIPRSEPDTTTLTDTQSSETNSFNESNTTPDSEPSVKPLSEYDTTEPQASNPVFATPPAKSKRPLVIGLVVALLVVLLGAGAAYALWYNKPDKVIDDALASVVTTKNGSAKGSLTVTPKGSPSFLLNFDSKAVDKKTQTNLGLEMTNEGKTYKVGGDIVTSDQSSYVKLSNLKSTLQSLYGDSSALTAYDSILSKIDNKWVVITPDDIKRLSGDGAVNNKETECVQNVLDGVRTNKAQQKELADVYQKNRFILVKELKGSESVEGRQSNHYVLSLDETKAKSFGTALKNTSVFKAVDDCVSEDLAKSSDNAETKTDSSNLPTIELWVDMWTHKPTKLKISSNSKEETKVTFESILNLGSKVSINVPKADTTVKDIETEINKLQQDIASQYPSSEL